VPLRFPRVGNPHYPLPPDYETLSPEGQRLARVNAVSLRETPEDYVWSWHFFREYYLKPEESMFYLEPAPSSKFHYDLAYFRGAYPRNVILAPRGSAKSTVVGTEFILLDALAGPRTPTLLVLAKDAFVEQRFAKLMIQLEHNPRIFDDFGAVRPTRGQAGTYNKHCIMLPSGVEIYGESIQSITRGYRVKFLLFDDVEYDPTDPASNDKLRGLFRDKFRAIFLPMLRKGSSVYVIGTGHRRDLLVYHMAHTKDDPTFTGPEWNRRIYTAKGPSGLLWEGGLPQDFLDTQALALGDKFSAEYMNDPQSATEPALVVDPALCEYEVEGNPQAPLTSEAPTRWNDCHREPSGAVRQAERTAPFREVLGGMTRFITIDLALTQGPDSDFSVVHVMGLDRLNQLWSLEVWGGKVRQGILLDKAWALAEKWGVRMIGTEDVGIHQEMIAQLIDKAALLREQRGASPGIVRIKYVQEIRKGPRICSMGWRFRRGLVKLPRHLAGDAHVAELYRQIKLATPDLALLVHDDYVDTMAMACEMVQGTTPQRERFAPPESPEARIVRGEYTDEAGIPHYLRIDPDNLDHRALTELLSRATLEKGAISLMGEPPP